MPRLFDSFTLRDIRLRNRIAMSPMVQYAANNGLATNWHFIHYGTRAVGGAGLIMQEATAVSPEGRITPGDLGIYSDRHIEKLQEITSFIRQQGAVPGIQLAHGGRKASCSSPWNGGKQLSPEQGGWNTMAPSPIAFQEEDRTPIELDEIGIQKVILDFRIAAERAKEAGYQVVEIHSAHGYLIHEFLSPLSNHRNDRYGGSRENRFRLLMEIVRSVREAWPENFPLFVRLSATDWVEGGWNIDETILLSEILKKMGVDLIDTSSGGIVPYAQIPTSPGYQVPFSNRIRLEAGIPTGAVGLITDARHAEEILVKGQADLVLFARELLRNPYFPLKAARELGVDVTWPKEYLRARI